MTGQRSIDRIEKSAGIPVAGSPQQLIESGVVRQFPREFIQHVIEAIIRDLKVVACGQKRVNFEDLRKHLTGCVLLSGKRQDGDRGDLRCLRVAN